MAELATIKYDAEVQGFYATFNRRVGELQQADEIYLQLPNSPDSQHDNNYDEATINSCIELVSKFYSDEDLSVMSIINGFSITCTEIREATSITCTEIREATVSFTDDEGDKRFANTYVLNLRDGDVFLMVDVSAIHRHYTGNKAWVVDEELNSRFTDFEKIAIFESSTDKVY